MNKISGKVVIFIASIALGFFIMTNINFDSISISKQLNSQEYKKAIDERNDLYNEIEKIKEENYDYRYNINKYNKYNNSENSDKKLIEDMKKQVQEYGMLSGVTAVTGPGVIIKIDDGEVDYQNDTEHEMMRKILHDNDVALVLNEVRKAGAEAIALNDHRIINMTGVNCYWAFILFDDKTEESAPFYIYAIGNPSELKASLLADDSHIQKLIVRKLKVEIEEKEEIIIPGTIQSMEPKYMQRYEVK